MLALVNPKDEYLHSTLGKVQERAIWMQVGISRNFLIRMITCIGLRTVSGIAISQLYP